jgi:hypothetical protein
MHAKKERLAPWQPRWVTLHDDLHLLEVLLNAITAYPASLEEYWSLSADVLTFSQDLQESYEAALASEGQEGADTAFEGLRRRLLHLQARAQTLSLDNELDA